MAFSQLVNSMAMLLLMILPGFIFKKLKMINEDQTKSVSNIIVNLIVPAIIINALQVEKTGELMGRMASLAVFWAVMIIIGLIIWVVWSKARHMDRVESSVLAGALLVPNTGFIGIPLINQFYGAEGLLYVSICEIISDICVFTIIYTIISRSAGVKEKMKIKELLSPPIVAVIIGYALFAFEIKLPDFISGAVQNISGASAALAMFVLGSQLADIKGKEFFGDLSVYPKVAGRLILMPVIAFIILRVIVGDTSLISTVFILSWGLPAGVFCVVLAEKFGANPSMATKSVMLSNIFCLITTSVWAMAL